MRISNIAAASVTLAAACFLWSGVFAQAYKPPQRGAPSGAARVGGGVRGPEGQTFALSVIAPDHVGLTSREQPTLYWFTPTEITVPAELTLITESQDEPLLDLWLKPPIEPGIHSVSLAEQGIRLRPDVPYQWFVAVVVDPRHRSSDVIAGGEIQRTAVGPDVAPQLASADEQQKPLVYASNGYWYDAFEGLTALLAGTPSNRVLREQRAALLEQVGLGEAAAFERTERR